jgi:asparagine synthase (glutamine-hydrolysing)
VVLSGVGGDEAFLGYHKYRWLAKRAFILRALWSLPGGLRASISETLMRMPHTRLGSAIRASIMPEHSRNLFSQKEIQSLTGTFAPTVEEDSIESDPLYALLRSDVEHYLPDMLLRDLDAMTMSQSLEARAPLLDRELLEFTWQLPLSIKSRGTTKQLLLDAVSDILPNELKQKPKTGFELPMREWLVRGTLRPCLDMLATDSLRVVEAGLLNRTAVTRVYHDFLQGKSHYLKPWSIMVLEHWYRSMEAITRLVNSSASE